MAPSLASTDGQYHLMFHQLFENDLAQSTRVEDQRLLRDVKWTNQNCVLGFTVQGILESGESEGSLVNCLEVSPSRGFVVAGDDRGCLSLYRYPVLEKGHRAHEYHSHSSVVANVRWSVDEKYVISAEDMIMRYASLCCSEGEDNQTTASHRFLVYSCTRSRNYFLLLLDVVPFSQRTISYTSIKFSFNIAPGMYPTRKLEVEAVVANHCDVTHCMYCIKFV